MYKTGGILLCAGFGSRLAPLTDKVPKPAIPFCGVPMAHYARRALEAAHVEDMGMNVHHLPEHMIAAMDDGTWLQGQKRLHISREGDAILGTGGGASRVAAQMPDMERFILYHGDVLCGAELSDALESHIRARARVTLVVLPRPRQIHDAARPSLGMIGVKNHEIVLIRDWAKAHEAIDGYLPRCFAGIHIVERSLLDAIPKDQNTCLVTQVYRQMLACGETIHAWEPPQDVFFADVGTPATYLQAQAQALSRHRRHAPDRLAFFRAPQYLSDETAEGVPAVAFSSARLSQNIRTGENVCLCEGARWQPDETLIQEMRFGQGGIRLSGAWMDALVDDVETCRDTSHVS